MVVVNTKQSTLNRIVGKSISIEELEKVLFDFGMELESHEGDDIAIEITAERSDLVSAHGIGRALKAYLGIKKGMPVFDVTPSGVKVIVDKSVADVRPFTVAAVVKNLHLTDDDIREIIAVQEKIHQSFARRRRRAAIGIYPLDPITPPINYLALPPDKISFQPLDAQDKMTATQILTDHPAGKDYAHLLDGKDAYPIFRDAQGEILSMPPIINSEKLGRVTEHTKDIFIECSGFDLGLLKTILNILATMFADMGGTVQSVDIKYQDGTITTPDLAPIERTVSLKNVRALLGIDLDEKQVSDLLLRMLYKVVSSKGGILTVRIPRIRADVWHEVDIIDDVARAYGFNNVAPTFPNIMTVAATLPLSDLKEQLAQAMVGLGFFETTTLGLTNEEHQYKRMELKEEPHITIKDSAEKGFSMVRAWLLPENLLALHYNRHRPYPQRIFECGFAVVPDKDADVKSRNELKLCALICDRAVTFTHARQALDAALRPLGLTVNIRRTEHPSFLSGRVGRIIVKGIDCGIIGEMHPKVLENWGLTVPTAGFEISVDAILSVLKKKR